MADAFPDGDIAATVSAPRAMSRSAHRAFAEPSRRVRRGAARDLYTGSMHAWELVALTLSALSLAVYLALQGVFFLSLRRGRSRRPGDPPDAPTREALREVRRAPRISVLKPLAGGDDELAENLASFARLDYPSFELLLGVAHDSDPALPVAQAFARAHPALSVRVVRTDPHAALNPKVAQLIGLNRVATGDAVLVSDSNVRVAPDYLWAVAAELTKEGVGMVTTLFAGTGERTLGAALENLQLGTMTTPGIVAFDLLSARPLTVGKSMAMWRRDLARVGGFASVGDVLAEDYVLGRRFAEEGYGVRTSRYVVENRNVACSFGRTLERHARWAKMRRALSPWTFALEPLLSPLLVSTLAAVALPGKLTAAALLLSSAVQTLFAALDLRALRGRALAWTFAPLEIVRTYVIAACWLSAWLTRRIEWRGHPFRVEGGTRIVPIRPHREARPSLVR